MRRRLFRTGSRRTGGRPWVGLRGYPVDLRGPLGGGGPDLGWLVRPPGVGSRFLRTLLWGGRLGAIRWFRTPGRSGHLYRWPILLVGYWGCCLTRRSMLGSGMPGWRRPATPDCPTPVHPRGD